MVINISIGRLVFLMNFMLISIQLNAESNSNFIDFTQLQDDHIRTRHSLTSKLLAPLMNLVQHFGLSPAWAGLLSLLILAVPFAIYFSIKNKENFFIEYIKFLGNLWWVLIFAVIGGIVGQMRYGK